MNLLNMLQKRDSTSLYARIIEKSTDTLYLVKDLRGRKFQAEANGSYKKGDSVKIKSGIIISKAKMPKSIKH